MFLFAPQGGANGGQPGPPPYRSPTGIQGPTQVHQQPFSNVMKRHANWNARYSCGFDVVSVKLLFDSVIFYLKLVLNEI